MKNTHYRQYEKDIWNPARASNLNIHVTMILEFGRPYYRPRL